MKLIDDLTKGEVKLPSDKSATTYVLLAAFLGWIGVHNLWAGNAEKGKAELICGLVLTCCCGLGIVTQIIALLDVANLIESQRVKA